MSSQRRTRVHKEFVDVSGVFMVSLSLLLMLSTSPQSGSPQSGSPQSGSPQSGRPQSGRPQSGRPQTTTTQRVGGSFVNVRAQPNASAKVIARLPFGLIVDAGEEKDGFRAVQIAELRGYIWQELLREPNAGPNKDDSRLIDSLTRPVAEV
ncbi:MAG: hypothetical protein GY822_14025 [Deltaproteobacteria bacterium]|nr:hypothetical protein [Deltaproteobacteria bacterium]